MNMEDLYPGCSTGRRLGLMRSIKQTLMNQTAKKIGETNRNGGQYTGSIASDHRKFHLIKKQLEEMETNRIETGFAVTNNELKEAISLGVYRSIPEPVAVGKGDWRIDGF